MQILNKITYSVKDKNIDNIYLTVFTSLLFFVICDL